MFHASITSRLPTYSLKESNQFTYRNALILPKISLILGQDPEHDGESCVLTIVFHDYLF